MKKIICQNCFEILAERNDDKGVFRYDPNKMDTVCQEIDKDHCLLTLSCPKCGCMLQVKV